MTTTTDSTAAAGTTAPVAKKKSPRGMFNQAQLRNLAKADTVATAAKKDAHKASIAARDISDAFVATFVDDIAAARAKANTAVDETMAAKAATKEEKDGDRKLIAGLKEVQKAVKQKYGRGNRAVLEAYFVGKKLNGSRPNLLQTSQSIIDKVATETLPGITAAKKTRLKAARQIWIDANTKQADARFAAYTARREFKTLLKSIDERRLAIQTAVDAEWPHTDAENAGTRKDFALPADRPMAQ
ncbi:MAG: hypothetical protein RLY20_101 [Verrucomicrobiota bacterium]